MQPVAVVCEYTFQSSNPQPDSNTATTMREFKSKDFWRAVLAELVGMTLFIFLSISTAIGSTNPDQEVKVSLAFGLAIATLAQSLGHISGAHLNPAVTLGMLASCQISVFKAVMYIVAQMLGSALASGIVYGTRPSTTDKLGLNALTGVTPSQGVGIELLATFQLVLCVIAVTDKRRRDVTGSAPLAIGLSVCLGHLAAISYTGCGINPARSFGPALILNNFTNHWLNRVTKAQGFIIEFLATLQLVLCVIAVTDKRRSDVKGSAPLAIGLSVGLGHFAAISFTGCGINPARSFGPALIRSKMENHWVMFEAIV
uniref:Aquaporin 1 (Colton blood group) n=1 Tax=Sparus aurata TaxID=8175 RepID=A0A671XZK7_SPAAU